MYLLLFFHGFDVSLTNHLNFVSLFVHFRTGTKFSVRVSAVEIVGRSETVRDLLAEQATGN